MMTIAGLIAINLMWIFEYEQTGLFGFLLGFTTICAYYDFKVKK